jgi:hypothetical protein
MLVGVERGLAPVESGEKRVRKGIKEVVDTCGGDHEPHHALIFHSDTLLDVLEVQA